MKTCEYCEFFAKLKIINPNRPSSEKAVKKCTVKNKEVSKDTVHCEYFSPSKNFYCYANQEYVNILACLSRRLNKNTIPKYSNCIDCNQFNEFVREIIIDYYINQIPVMQKKIEKLPNRRKKEKGDINPRTEILIKMKQKREKKIDKKKSRGLPNRRKNNRNNTTRQKT